MEDLVIHKKQFLKSEHVKGFLKYFRPFVTGDAKFYHHYLEKQLRKVWQCNSIPDAFMKYRWPINSKCLRALGFGGHSFECNKKLLDVLKKQLQTSFEEEKEAELVCAAQRILKWGGRSPNNAEKIREFSKERGFHNYLETIGRCIGDGSVLDFSVFKHIESELTSNSGFTKIYSLLFEDFVIYDSRVAAALCLFIVQYCVENSIEGVPGELNFAIPPSRTPDRRNPSFFGLQFRDAKQSHRRHFEHNIKATWLLKAAVPEAGFCGQTGADALRAVEAALFMIGYDVSSAEKTS